MVWIFHRLSDVPTILYGLGSLVAQSYFLGKPHWTTEEMADQSGRTIIITGGNSGVGKACAKALLQRNANVYLACRSQSSAQSTIFELEELTGKKAKFIHLDLSNLGSVKTAVEEFLRNENQLHVLFNNAGIMFTPMEDEINGYDSQIHTNVLGHFYLTKLLLPTLLSSTEESFKPRVVNVSSSGHYVAGSVPLDFNTFKSGPMRRRRITEEMYAQSKFANIVVSKEFARRYGEQGIVFTSVNPGNLKTNLNRHVTSLFKKMILSCIQLYPAELGAVTQLWAATAPETAELNGKFLIPWARIGLPRHETEDPQLGKDLWDWLEEQIED